MSHSGRKNKRHDKKGVRPMPSLIFHEGNINNDELELKTATPATGPIQVPEAFRPNGINYNKNARKLMWFGVILLGVIICGMWIWSMSVQFSSVKWSASPEKELLDKTRENWNRAFSTDKPISTEELKNEVKENLVKLFAGVVTSTASTTPEVNAATTTE